LTIFSQIIILRANKGCFPWLHALLADKVLFAHPTNKNNQIMANESYFPMFSLADFTKGGKIITFQCTAQGE
jgi:hypothetical protein